MILIDSLYLNSPGGKKIFNIFFNNICKHLNSKYYFLFDKRIDEKYLKNLNKSQYSIINNSEFERTFFYLKIKKKIKKCICLSNVPPSLKLNCEVIIYFHNDLILRPNMVVGIDKKLSFIFKRTYLFYKNSINYTWVVQTDLMLENLSRTMNINKSKIKVLPIFDDYKNLEKSKKKINTFIYVSSKSSHKNIERLIHAFNNISNPENDKIYLHLTIEDENYFKKINAYNNNKNLKIINHGSLDWPSIINLYKKTEYLIFPSLIESFGLPLIESIHFGCKVICSDLKYAHEIILPTLTFNPFEINSISESIDIAILNKNLDQSKILIKNKIDKFIELIAS